jgi:hypothetical protein
LCYSDVSSGLQLRFCAPAWSPTHLSSTLL